MERAEGPAAVTSKNYQIYMAKIYLEKWQKILVQVALIPFLGLVPGPGYPEPKFRVPGTITNYSAHFIDTIDKHGFDESFMSA